MSTLITALHVIVCLFLMLTVLLQSGKGGGMGGAFGGSNAGTVFGGSGASTFLRKLTAGAATIFMLTSMTLAYIASHNSADSLERFSASEQEAAAKKQAARDKALESGSGSGSGSATPNIMMPTEMGSATTIQLDNGSGTVTVPVENGSAATPAMGSAATPAEKAPVETPAEKPAAPSMTPTSATQKPNDKTPTGATPTPPAPKEPITGTAAPTQKPQPASAPGEATPAAPSTP